MSKDETDLTWAINDVVVVRVDVVDVVGVDVRAVVGVHAAEAVKEEWREYVEG